jgi:hypothetical protein
MPEPVPIYSHQRTENDYYYYDDQKPGGDDHWREGVLRFYAYPVSKPTRTKSPPTATDGKNGYDHKRDGHAYYYEHVEGTIDIYRHRPGGADLYKYDSKPEGSEKPAFYAYAVGSTAEGIVPVYVHDSVKGQQRVYYDTKESAPDDGWSRGTVAFKALPVGYRIGDKAADIKGPDQQNKQVSLLNDCLGGGNHWVLIDVSAGWCGACETLATEIQAFVASVNNQGVPLKLFSVLADGFGMEASRAIDADAWALKYNMTDSVLQCAGLRTSDLLQLPARYALLNGSDEPGYPTLVLIDPKGVVRHYQASRLLEDIGKSLASLSGHSLSFASGTPGSAGM